MVEDVQRAIDDIHSMSVELKGLNTQVEANLLERLNGQDGASEKLRRELDGRLEDFLQRAERVVSAKLQDRRER